MWSTGVCSLFTGTVSITVCGVYYNISKLKNIIDMNYEERRGVNLLSARRSAPSTLVTTVEVVVGMLDPFASVQVPRLFGMERNNRRITTTVAALLRWGWRWYHFLCSAQIIYVPD